MKVLELPFLVLVAILGGMGCSSVAPEKPVAGDEFFPLEDGRVHLFKAVRGDGSPTVKIKDISQGHGYWNLDFSQQFSMGVVRDSSGIGVMVLGMGHGATPLDPPLLLVPPMVTEGVAWSSTSKVGTRIPEAKKHLAEALARDPQMQSLEFTSEGSETSTDTVAGGKSYRTRCVELRMSGKDPKGQQMKVVLARLWIAPGVGIVKADLGAKTPTTPAPSQSWELTEIKHER